MQSTSFRTRINLITVISIFAFSTNCFCQENYCFFDTIEFTTKSDYVKYNSEIINCANWLKETDLNRELDKRRVLNKLTLKWLLGDNPNIKFKLSVNSNVLEMMSENPQLLSLYFALVGKYILDNPTNLNNFNATKAGLIGCVEVYQKNIGIIRTKMLEELIYAYTNTQLDKFIVENLHIMN